MKFVPAGPQRFSHQLRALRRIIETRGVCALLMDPGTGKSAVVLDYLSLLALKSPRGVEGVREVRALIISPKAAVDNWVIQAQTYLHAGVDVWAEALGGSIRQKAESLMSRGPRAYKPRKYTRDRDRKQNLSRGINSDRAELLWTRGARGPKPLGPADVGTPERPRLVIASTNLDTFASRARTGSGSGSTIADTLVRAVQAFQPDVIVVDESHKIKSATSNTSRLVARLSDLTPRRLILTGTVMPHSPMDVFGQWRFLKPTAFGLIKGGERQRASFGAFQKRYGVMGGYMGREVVSYQNLDEMQAIMAENAIVVKKSDALDLPEMRDVEVPLVLSTREQRAYDDMRKELAAQLDSGDLALAQNRLTQILRLRQITSGHLPDLEGNVQTLGTSKVDMIRSIANDTLEGENRIVVFAYFAHEIRALAEGLAQRGTEVLVIDGHTPQDERLRIRRRFGSSDPARLILIAQVRTISLSVNEMVTARHAIFASLSQQRDDLVQARDRLNRIGQRNDCTFWYVLARGTIDETIWRSHQGRTDLEAALLAHVKGTSEGESISAPVGHFTD